MLVPAGVYCFLYYIVIFRSGFAVILDGGSKRWMLLKVKSLVAIVAVFEV